VQSCRVTGASWTQHASPRWRVLMQSRRVGDARPVQNGRKCPGKVDNAVNFGCDPAPFVRAGLQDRRKYENK
jgi:hypothetical protein